MLIIIHHALTFIAPTQQIASILIIPINFSQKTIEQHFQIMTIIRVVGTVFFKISSMFCYILPVMTPASCNTLKKKGEKCNHHQHNV